MTILDATTRPRHRPAIALDDRYVAHNYSPLPVVAASAEGAWITDVEGRRYLDCLAAYSAVNFGHRHPEITATAHAQLDTVTLVSRAFHSDRLGPFCAALAAAVRQGHGAADEQRRRSRRERHQGGPQVGHRRQGRARGQANIVVAHNNFHGRTTTIISFSDDETARRGFGPYTPGFRSVPFGDADAMAAAIDDEHRRRAARTDPGRGGHHRPARRLPAARARAVHRTQRADDRRRDPVGPGPHRSHLRAATTGTSCPTSTCWARRSAAASSRCRRWSPTGTCSACCTPASTGRRSAATRWRRRSAPPWSACSRRGEFQRRVSRTRCATCTRGCAS